MSLQDLFDTAVSREAAWLQADLSGNGLPSLTAAGSFGTVGAYPRTIARRGRELFLYRESCEYSRYGAGGVVRLVHHFVAVAHWPLAQGTNKMAEDQQALDSALGALLWRISGLPFDKTHGGRFEEAGEEGGVRVEWRDPTVLAADERLRVDVHYAASDSQPG